MTGFGERLRKIRRDADVTQKQLAEYLGVKGAAVGKWENNETYPNTDTLIKVVEYFNVSTDYLLRGIQTFPASESTITNSSLSGSVVQTNVHGGIVLNGQAFSQEALTLAQIYGEIDVRSRSELLAFAFKLKDKVLEKKTS